MSEKIIQGGESDAAIQARKDAWISGQDEREDDEAVGAVDGQKILRAVIKWIAPLVGKTPSQARSEIKDIYKDL